MVGPGYSRVGMGDHQFFLDDLESFPVSRFEAGEGSGRPSLPFDRSYQLSVVPRGAFRLGLRVGRVEGSYQVVPRDEGDGGWT